MSNGCGCQTGILKYIKIPYAEYFYVPCCIHDDDYDRGGNEDDRKLADIMLYSNMKKISKNWKHKFTANIFYICVRIFGRFYFNYYEKKEFN